jgi:glyoxylase-like metal-dependent hydrolase (beta-lactamase superfamily II)
VQQHLDDEQNDGDLERAPRSTGERRGRKTRETDRGDGGQHRGRRSPRQHVGPQGQDRGSDREGGEPQRAHAILDHRPDHPVTVSNRCLRGGRPPYGIGHGRDTLDRSFEDVEGWAAVGYTGEVIAGGAADVRRLPEAVVRKVSVGDLDNNAYLITCLATGRQLLIDAADDAPRLLRLVAEGAADGGSGLDLVVTTHQHRDHHRALARVLAATGAASAAGRDDAGGLPVVPTTLLDHGDVVTVGDLRLDVVHLRGHTPGSVTLVLRSADGSTHAFTGDSLFPGGVGNTHGNAAHFASLIDDVDQRLFAVLPDETWVYPGHGKDTTLGAERPHLPEWRERGW